jgi:hypothetical protein
MISSDFQRQKEQRQRAKIIFKQLNSHFKLVLQRDQIILSFLGQSNVEYEKFESSLKKLPKTSVKPWDKFNSQIASWYPGSFVKFTDFLLHIQSLFSTFSFKTQSYLRANVIPPFLTNLNQNDHIINQPKLRLTN